MREIFPVLSGLLPLVLLPCKADKSYSGATFKIHEPSDKKCSIATMTKLIVILIGIIIYPSFSDESLIRIKPRLFSSDKPYFDIAISDYDYQSDFFSLEVVFHVNKIEQRKIENIIRKGTVLSNKQDLGGYYTFLIYRAGTCDTLMTMGLDSTLGIFRCIVGVVSDSANKTKFREAFKHSLQQLKIPREI